MGKFIIKLVCEYDRIKRKYDLNWFEILSLALTILSTILMILEFYGMIEL